MSLNLDCPARVAPHHRDLRHHVRDRRAGQRRRLSRHHQEQVDALGHELLSLLPRHLRSGHSHAR